MSHQPSTERKSVWRVLRSIRLDNLFVLLVGASAVLGAVIYAIRGNGSFSESFFIGGGDFFMDFFNSIRDASQGSGVYSERGVIYPPMANLIFLFLSRFTPTGYHDSSFPLRRLWVYYDACLLLVFVTIVVCTVLLTATLFWTNKTSSLRKRATLSCAVLVSTPILYLMERGNILLLTLVALMIYASTYESKSKRAREIGLLALAFAFSIKLYPVVFGWLLLVDKRYKDAARCALYGVAMLILPSFFFGGPVFCFTQCLHNIFNFSTGSGNTITKVMAYVGISKEIQEAVNLLAYLWVLICGICFALSAFLPQEKRWRSWLLGCVTILCVPSLTGIYSWAFFLIPLLCLFEIRKPNRSQKKSAVLMTLPFLHLPFRFSLHVPASIVLVYLTTAVLSIYAVAGTAKELMIYFRKQKSL